MRFRRALMLMTMTLLVPGSAQLVAGGRQVGQVALRIWLGLVAFAVVSIPIGMVSHEYVFWLASDTALLQLFRFVLMALAVGWAALLVDAWRLGQPLTLSLHHRRTVVGVNGVLCLSVAGTLLFGAHLVGVQRDFILTMFAGDEVTSAHHGRYNVLLLGGDSGAGRWGLRPDSLTVASIDEETGRTVLVGLPRNMTDFPFAKGSVMAKQFPKGFDCETCYLNAREHLGRGPHRTVRQVRAPRRRGHHDGRRGHHRAGDQLLGDGQPPGLPRPGRRGRRSHPQRAPADPGRWTRAAMSPATSSPACASSTATTCCGSRAPARAPTTTPGWRARSA